MLETEGLVAGYGRATVLHGLDLRIGEGELVALLGRNGMGKTTAIRVLMGLIRPRAGRVLFQGRELTGLSSHQIARKGLGLVPEGRQVFPRLTVAEHLTGFFRPPAFGDGRRWQPADVFDLFPRLADRARQQAAHLSGGEQQMLAIGRALVTNPRLLILDEATEGLAPRLRTEIWASLGDVRQAGQSILLVDKPSRHLDQTADRALVMEKGRIVWRGRPFDLRSNPGLSRRLLGV